jgi:hypothetical protein
VDGDSGYWVSFVLTLDLSPSPSDVDVSFEEITIGQETLTTPGIAGIIGYAPTGWELDVVNGYGSTINTFRMAFVGENVMQALIAIAEATNEHFILGSGRKVIWLRGASATAAVRATHVVSALAAEDDDDIALITRLEKTDESWDLITRVYAVGAEYGSGWLTLANSDDGASAGYTLDTVANCLEHDAAVLAYGVIERYVQWSEISPINDQTGEITRAGNALLAQAHLYLSQHIAAYTSYQLSLAKVDQEILPGQTIRCTYHEWLHNYHVVDIDADLVVLSATTEIGTEGIRTVALTVATQAKWPLNDQSLLADAIRKSSQVAQPVVYQV